MLNYENPLVIMSHPDDEILSCVSFLKEYGKKIKIIYTTNGRVDPEVDASYYKPYTNQEYNQNYLKQRKDECNNALKLFNINPNNIYNLDFDNGTLYKNWNTVYQLLFEFISTSKPDVIITNAFEGGNFDHDITNIIVHHIIQQSECNCTIIDAYLYNYENGKINHNKVPNLQKENSITKCFFVERKLSEQEYFLKTMAMNEYKSQFDTDIKYFIKDRIENFLVWFENRNMEELERPHNGQLMYEKFANQIGIMYDDLLKINEKLNEKSVSYI